MTTNIIMAVVTAYCSCTKCTKGTGITANGSKPQQGITVAASRSIPFGSKAIIGGVEYTVQDRLAKRFDKRFDIYFAEHKDARQFGIKTQQVVLIIR